MHLWIGVENFAKIERARVCVNKYTLFVGPNNSGKTFLMQLVQGLGDKIVRLLEEDAMDILLEQKIEGYSKYLLYQGNVAQFVDYINAKLHLKKEQLVKEIFGKEIPIEKLYIDLELEEDVSYQIDITDIKSLENEKVKESIDQIVLMFKVRNTDKKDTQRIGILIEIKNAGKKSEVIALRKNVGEPVLFYFINLLKRFFEDDSLYLPASRTGLMLLYRDFFASKTDDAVSFRVEDGELLENKEQYGGLTQPIYAFLRFLQTYIEDEYNNDKYRDELAFFEENIIEGHISVNKQGNFSYQEKDDSNMVPMHLASAMINEVAPLELALASQRRYERLIIDEVEASLHPQKQLQFVRFLNRINNNGIKLIISTHSDTFVSKLNNLYVVSELVRKKKDDEVLQRFQLQEEDLIQPESLFVYEFVCQSKGKSVVKEIKPDSQAGFQFELFAKSAMELYEESLRLGELQLDD